MNSNFSYTGKEDLYLLQQMTIYNNHIAHIFSKNLHHKTTLLDFGAGIGTITSLVKAKLPLQTIDCLEIDSEQQITLTQKGFKVFDRLSAIPANIYDGVLSSNVLEHIEHDVEALKQLNPKLVDGARLVFWVPAFMCLWSKLDDHVAHYRRYTRQSLAQTFQDAGFVVEKTYYADSLGFFIALLTTWFEKRSPRQKLMTAKTIRVYDRILFPLSKVLDLICWPFLVKM